MVSACLARSELFCQRFWLFMISSTSIFAAAVTGWVTAAFIMVAMVMMMASSALFSGERASTASFSASEAFWAVICVFFTFWATLHSRADIAHV